MTMTQDTIHHLRESQRDFFRTDVTLSISFRKLQLRALLSALQRYEKPLADALWTDLHKSYEEAYLTEFSILYHEVRTHLRHVHRWAQSAHYLSPLTIFPSRCKVISEPLGTALIMAPWNYPVQLLISPLIGAISAGCTAVLKPSPYVPHVSNVLEEMIRSAFQEEYIAIVQGHREVNQWLLQERWDMIFFTGSPLLGRTVMEAAARHLTPLVLELGGKSPCIIDKDAHLRLAARRAAWGKCLNAGQTCIAPDYILVHRCVREEFLNLLKEEIEQLLGSSPQESPYFCRIVSDKAMSRLIGYLKDGIVFFGGQVDLSTRYFSPTILTDVSPDAPVMQEEIFGPIFPVLTFDTIDEVITFVRDREKPLALYYFGENGDEILRRTSSGGACVNDTIIHIANPKMPFGGVGNSGMQCYHGKETFLRFTHQRSVVTTPTWMDVPFRYMPYRFFRWIKRWV